MGAGASLDGGIRTNPNKYWRLGGNLSQSLEQGGSREPSKRKRWCHQLRPEAASPRRGSMAQLGIRPSETRGVPGAICSKSVWVYRTPTLKKHLWTRRRWNEYEDSFVNATPHIHVGQQAVLDLLKSISVTKSLILISRHQPRTAEGK